MTLLPRLSAVLLGATCAVGCSTTDNCLLSISQSVAWNVNPAVPAAVRAPAGHVLLGHAIGRGIETFVLQADPADPDRSVWVMVRDEGGDLLDDNGHVIGHHEGNSWTVRSGGQVSGEPVAQVPQHGTVPWALLQATSHIGGGLAGGAEYIEQLHTVGGPPSAATGTTLGSEYRAQYSADYYFYGPLAPQTQSNRGGPYISGS